MVFVVPNNVDPFLFFGGLQMNLDQILDRMVADYHRRKIKRARFIDKCWWIAAGLILIGGLGILAVGFASLP